MDVHLFWMLKRTVGEAQITREVVTQEEEADCRRRAHHGNGTSRWEMGKCPLVQLEAEIGKWKLACTVVIMKAVACVCVVVRAGRGNAQDQEGHHR